ncbi:MAG: 5-formyltetrahydrofolate cyclo-ligase [Candidatus Aenigmarchaeota archaeon]|nr:5-formyltetrahydrofolate cyclo-ligase [Candidatus Aenigmarchaeota archaeon]
MKRHDLRNELILKRNALNRNLVIETSKVIVDKVRNYEPFKKSTRIMLYFEIGNEVKISPLLDDSKEFYLPKLLNNSIVPIRFTGFDRLETNNFGVKEPSGSEIDKNRLEICIVPGVCFDVEGNRMGYGKGFYDRFLGDFNGLKIGICYEFQLVEKVHEKKHDITMDVIITEKDIYENKW